MAAEWRQLFELPSDLRRWIGPTARAGEAVTDAFVRDSQVGSAVTDERAAAELDDIQSSVAAWARQGFVHWCDLELSDAWFRRAMLLTDDAHTAEVDALPYLEQIRRTREAFDALLNGYLALDLPCVVDPYLRGVVERDTDGPAVNPCDSKRWGEWARQHGAYLVGPGASCTIVRERFRLTAASTYDYRQNFQGECEADGTPRGVDWSRHFGLRGGRWSWNSWAFNDECLHRGGFLQAGACEDAISSLLPPLRFYWDWVREISRACVRRGPARVLVESVRFALMLNARESLQLRDRMTANERRDTAGQFAALERIAREDLARAQDGGEFFRRPLETPFGTFTPNEMFAGLSGAAGLVAGPAALIVSLVYGLARLLVSWVPAAVARNVDVFGRNRPVFERAYITSDPTVAPTPDAPRRGAPTHDVAEPPGFARTGLAPQGFELFITPGVLGEVAGVHRRGVLMPRAADVAESAITTQGLVEWQRRGLVVPVRGELPSADGETARPHTISLPPSREGDGDGAAVATAGGAAVVLLLVLLASRARSGPASVAVGVSSASATR